MDGWMNVIIILHGVVDGWVDGWMNGWMDGLDVTRPLQWGAILRLFGIALAPCRTPCSPPVDTRYSMQESL